MADFTTPNYPVSYEDDSSLLAPIVDRVITTVKTVINVDALQATLEEDLGGYQGDPCFMVFEGGEIWRIEAGDLSFPGGDTLVTLSSTVQRGYANSPIQPHPVGEEVYFTAISHHQISFKEAVIEAQKNGFLMGTEAERTSYEAGAVEGEGWLTTTDGQKVYICFSDGTWTWVNLISHLDVTGFNDDDHTQYHTDGRADTWHAGLSKSHIESDEDHDHRTANEGAAVKRLVGGVDASRPGSPTYAGQAYFSIDIETLFMSVDGVIWDQLSGTPSGAIAMYAGACPSGWTRYTALDDGIRPFVDAADIGATGGAITHNHVFTVNREHYHLVNSVQATGVTDPGNHGHSFDVESGSGGNTELEIVSNTTGVINTTTDGDHSHDVTIPTLDTDSVGTASPTTTTNSSEPPYKEVVFCKKD